MDPSPLFFPNLTSLRSRLEALRHGPPMPGLMAEVPAGHVSPFDERVKTPEQIVAHLSPSKARELVGAAVLLPGQPVGELSAARRFVWVAGKSVRVYRFKDVCHAGAMFAPVAREAAGLPPHPDSRCESVALLWALFEVAERRVQGSPLQLRGGGVTVARGLLHFQETQIAAARTSPPGENFAALALRDVKTDPTRYWKIDDMVEALVQLLDIVESRVTQPAPRLSEEPAAAVPTEARRGGRGEVRIRGQTLDEALATLASRDRRVIELKAAKLVELLEESFGETCSVRTIQQNDTYRNWGNLLKETRMASASELKGKQDGSPSGDGRDRYDLGADRLESTRPGRTATAGRQRQTRKEIEDERKTRAFLAQAGAKA
jgi:hypothetical protein